MRFSNIFIFLFVYLCFPSGIWSQVGNTIHERYLLREFDEITEHLIVTHPALYRFIDIDSLDQLIATTRAKIVKPMDQLEFYKLVSPIFATVSDGHTKILIDEDLYKSIHNQKGIFPFKVWLDDENRMFVIGSDLDETSLEFGSEILSINKTPVQQFIEECSPFISFEHKSYRNSVISDNLNWLLALTQDYTDVLEIEYQLDAEIITKEITLTPFRKWKRRSKKLNKKKRKKVLEFENNEYRNLGNKIGYLKIHEFGSYDIVRYIENIKEIFVQVNKEGIKSLILDVRDNAGGDPQYVEALIHSISNIPFCRTEMMYQLKKGRPNSYYRMLGHRDKEIVRFAANHMVFSGNEEAYREPIEFDNEYNGDIYLLVNEKSYSASTTLASVIKCYDLGTIVGTMTGGTRIFQAYSLAKSYHRSHFTTLVSSTMIFTSCSGFEDEYGYMEGIHPDVLVRPGINDILNNKDVQLEKTLELIKEGGYKKVYD